MSILINASGLSCSFGGRTLFKNLNFSIQSGERIGLIGPNGAGKSTLLKIIAGLVKPDDGTLAVQRNLKIGFLEQVPEFLPEATVRSTLATYAGGTETWEQELIVDELLGRLELEGSQGVFPETLVARLSGGWKKRVALGRALARQPDLLLLDEPTNHLDVESIVWLENFLQNAPFATLTITHDRVFLQKVSNRILELDSKNPLGLLSVAGSYADYLERKEALLSEQEQRETILKNTLRRETEWLKRGPKARSTKQQARIDRAGALQETVDELSSRNKTKTVSLEFQSAENKPKKLIEAVDISKAYGDSVLFSHEDLLITKGMRLGILGPNGSGKSSLIRTLLKIEAPDTGRVDWAEDLGISFFSQNRETLDPEQSLLNAICPKGDYVNDRGQFVHARGYLNRFLFNADQMNMKVRQLSGGEQSRLLLARLMLNPAHILVLDEPTNDLDLATLNLLQDCLMSFEGAVLLVTHDRYFLSQVATHILAFPVKQDQQVGKFVWFADLDQWENYFLAQQKSLKKMDSGPKQSPQKPSIVESQTLKKRKLSFKEQSELDGMEQKIESLEKNLAALSVEIALPENNTNPEKLKNLTLSMAELQTTIDGLYTRWAELEGK